MIELRGGSFLMGTEDPDGFPEDREGPVREVRLGPFAIDSCAVSNERFAEFVEATGHQTEAENSGWSFVFGGLLPDAFPPTRGIVGAPWWRQVSGAAWRTPEGPHSNLRGRWDHPVVHVSWADAEAFCEWTEAQLPSEAEWEFAARGGLEQRRFPWGDQLEPGGEHRMNVWQGSFPDANTVADGYFGTCPVDAFEPNGYGLYNMAGNVWEWCSDRFDGESCCSPPERHGGEPAMAIRGGSYLCHESYCNRYRVAARSSSTIGSTAGNVGFRCVRRPAQSRAPRSHREKETK